MSWSGNKRVREMARCNEKLELFLDCR